MSPKIQRTRPGSTSPIGDRPTLTPAVESLTVGAPRTADSRSAGLTESVTPVVRKSTEGDPLYLRLVRKEARLRHDQLEALAALRRRLSRARRRREEVLTDNTLIRIAVDLLLSHDDELHGDTEAELLASLTRKPTE